MSSKMEINLNNGSPGKPAAFIDVPSQRMSSFMRDAEDETFKNKKQPKKDYGTKYNHLPPKARWHRGKKKDDERKKRDAERRKLKESQNIIEPCIGEDGLDYGNDFLPAAEYDEELDSFFERCRIARENHAADEALDAYFENEYSTFVCEEVASTEFYQYCEDSTACDDIPQDVEEIQSLSQDSSSVCQAAAPSLNNVAEDGIPLGELIMANTYLDNEVASHRLTTGHSVPFRDVRAMSYRPTTDDFSQEAINFQRNIRRKVKLKLPTIDEVHSVKVTSNYLSYDKQGDFNAEDFLSTPIQHNEYRSVRYSADLINSYLRREKHFSGSNFYCSPGSGGQCAVLSYPPLLYAKGIPHRQQKADLKSVGKIVVSDGPFCANSRQDIVFTHGLYGHVSHLLLAGYSLRDALSDWKAVEEFKAIKFIAPFSVQATSFVRKHVKTKLKTAMRC